MHHIFRIVLIAWYSLSITMMYATEFSHSNDILQLPSVFSDNMMLQRNCKNPIWGKSAKNSRVTIRLNNIQINTTTDSNGYWHTTLPKVKVGKVYNLEINSSTGQKKTIHNIVVGDVYFASGQSNMAFKLKNSDNANKFIATTCFSKLRYFKVPQSVSYKPRFDISNDELSSMYSGKWNTCDSVNVKDFSAVAVYFANKINSDTQIPVGIIDVSWGGTPIQAFSSFDANIQTGFFQDELKVILSKTDSDQLFIDKKKETPQIPASVFNGMIHPIIPFGICGVLWYQGEHNWNYPILYQNQLEIMTRDFRKKWGKTRLPFFIVQLPGIGLPDSIISDYNWAVLRESQQHAAECTNSNLCVSIDLNKSGDLHPTNKRPVGERLAMLAENKIYHIRGGVLFPKLKSYKIHENNIVLHFNSKIYKLPDTDSIKGLTICGVDENFRPAKAILRGNKIIVSCAEIAKPIAVRYGWGGNPETNLCSVAGLPVQPFRTDTFKLPPDGNW